MQADALWSELPGKPRESSSVFVVVVVVVVFWTSGRIVVKSKKTEVKYFTWVCRNFLSVLEEEEEKKIEVK